MQPTSDDTQRRANVRSALIIGSILGAVFLALVVAVLVKGRGGEGGAGVAPGAVEVRTGAEWKQVPDGKRVQIRGKVAAVYADGIYGSLDLELPDGFVVSCRFNMHIGKDAPRDTYSHSDLKDWFQQLKPGAELIIVGRGSRNPPSLSGCDTVPPIPRVR